MIPDRFQRDADEVRLLLAPLKPTNDGHIRPVDDRASADLRRILSTPGGPIPTEDRPAFRPHASNSRWRPSRRQVLTSAAAACILAATVTTIDTVAPRGLTGLVGLGAESAQAATPPMLQYRPLSGTAASQLRAVAATTVNLSDDVGAGPVAHLQRRSWSLFTRTHGRQVASAIVEQQSQIWTIADGSGRLSSSELRDGQVSIPTETALAPGEWSYMWPLGSLSTDATTLATQLEQGHPVANGPVERLVAVTDAVREQPLSPAQRAALLAYLAATPDLRLEGAVRDRAGRDGIGVSLVSDHSGLPTKYTIIVDPNDGRVLAWEQALTTDAGALNIPVPSVIGYEIYMTADYQGSLDA